MVCAAVIATFKGHGSTTAAKKFPYSGVFRRNVIKCVGECFKIDAHLWEEDARRQGWHHHWRGNDLADFRAKQALLPLSANPKPWQLEQRRRRRMLRQLQESLGPESLWKNDAREAGSG